MRDVEARHKEQLYGLALAALNARRTGGRASIGVTDVVAHWVPGRIEFLGKHTDYAGGRSLLCAAERGFVIVARARGDSSLKVRDALSEEEVAVQLDGRIEKTAGHWSTYPLTVAQRMTRDFPGATSGADIAFASDLPRAAGMSSSSALVVATFLALSAVNDLASRADYQRAIQSSEDLAGYLGAVENGRRFGPFAGDDGVGTAGGSEDHTAILCGRPRSLVQYSFCPVRFERTAPLPSDSIFVIASSGIAAEKTGAARESYNRASNAASAVFDRWRAATGTQSTTLASALAEDSTAPDRMLAAMTTAGDAAFSAKELQDRLRQFIVESTEIVPAAGDALARGDLTSLGTLVDRSQHNAEELLGNQIPETRELAASARALGAIAASAFGAGFGGSVWALVRSADAERFRADWEERYRARFPDAATRSDFFLTSAGPAATRV